MTNEEEMNTDLLKKREEVIRKFKASRNRKREYIVKMEERMRRAYKERTGIEAQSFKVL